MIRDRLRLSLTAGKGGDGAVYFSKNGKPSGGDGGDGGSIIIEGSGNLYDYKSLANELKYKAEDGSRGGPNNMTGAYGKDLVLKVPLTTIIYNLDREEIGRITKQDEQIKFLTGGRGGLGNFQFRAGQAATLKKFTRGKAGEEAKIQFELELNADIIFIGFPNSGKSSMLNALTNTNVTVAAYPFTTLQPHLGSMNGTILMDLPGLIEGTFEGKGLGTHFVKHTRSAKFVAHFVSCEHDDVVEIYTKMRNEIEKIDKALTEKPEIIVLTKTDLYSDEVIDKKFEELKKLNSNIIKASVYNKEILDVVREKFDNMMK